MSQPKLTEQSVFVRGLVVQAEIGLNPDERGRRQPVRIDAALTLLPQPPQHLRDTFNYEQVVAAAEALATGGHIELVETFAYRLAVACLAHPAVQRARIAVAKPQALKQADAAGAEVVLERP